MSGSTSNDVGMKSLSGRLAETLSETRFDLEYRGVARDGQQKRVSRSGLDASELAEVYHAAMKPRSGSASLAETSRFT